MKTKVKVHGMLIVATVLIVAMAFFGNVSADGTHVRSSVSDASQIVLIKIDTDVLSISDINHGGIVHDYASLLPGTYAILIPDGYSQKEAIEYYEAIPGVIYAEPDSQVYVTATSATQPQSTTTSPVPIPGIIAGFVAGTVLGFLRRR